MCQRSEELMDLSMDPTNSDGKHNVLQTNDVTIEPPSSNTNETTTTITTTTIIANTENGKHSPAAALSPSSIILSPPDSDNEMPNNAVAANAAAVVINDEDYDEIKRFFDKKMHIIEKWLRDRASPDVQTKLHEATDFLLHSPKALRTSSVTSDLFQQWLSSSPIKVSVFFFNQILSLVF